MKIRFVFLVVLTVCFGLGCTPEADVIYTNASIWTGVDGADRATHLAVLGEEIVAVGGAEVLDLEGPATELVDLEGAFVLPGFIDNHTHFMSGGFQLASVDLRDAASPEEFARRIALFAGSLPEGRWITGGDWDHERWGGALPQRAWIDAHTPETPVFITRLDGHMALANTKTLTLAGITRDTPDPEGGTIVRDPQTGEPTGVLKDEAMALVYPVMPDPDDAEEDAALARAMEHAVALGVTQVHDMGLWHHLRTYRRAHERGDLKLRIYSFVPVNTWRELADFVEESGRGDDWLRWGGLKGFVDGSLGSTTAAFYDPYEDEPHTSGLVVTDTTALRQTIQQADAAGLHLAIHAIGDKANDWLLSAFAYAETENGPADRRWRIEHAQHLSPAAFARFAELGVIPSMQPYHAIDDGRWAEKRIGPERIKTTYAFHSLLAANAALTFGSDWTVAPISPLEGIYAAVTRRTIDGANPNGWVPDQKISVEAALKAYTQRNAFAGFQEDRLGQLAPGFLADFVVLSADLFTVDPVHMPRIQVLRTVIGGHTQYQRQMP